MRTTAVLAAIVLLAAGLPAVSAKHLSVGWTDSVAMDAQETPEMPTVTEEDYQIGTTRDCYAPDPSNRSVDELQRARASDAFCGELVYHADTPYENVADRDQQLNGPIAEFDVIRAGQPFWYYNTCYPWCSSNAAGPVAFEAFHSVGETLGLTESPSEADRKDGENEQAYSIAVTFPAASHILQNADAHRMNGWSNPQPMSETFVGFLYDEAREPIDDERLRRIVEDNRENLPQEKPIENTICGFTPFDFVLEGGTLSIHYSPNSGGWCQIYFEWVEESGNGSDFRDGYNDRCASPTYVCGAMQPAWQATVTCLEFDGCTKSGTSSPEFEYSVWHWVVAPAQSDCNGQQLPGVSFDTDAQWDYLAHDLDVWTPATSLHEAEETAAIPNLRDYASGSPDALAEEAVDTFWELYFNATEILGEVGNQIDLGPDVQKNQRVEPNHDPDDLARMDLSEDSQAKSWPREDPNEGTTCSSFFSSFFVDTEDTIDPWVNIVDLDTVAKRYPFFTSGTSLALYGNDADHQDRVNSPTTGPVIFSGMVGIFTDKDDNGYYDNYALGGVEEGAYGLYWDLHLDTEGHIDTEAGCELQEGKRLPEAMQEAHYGPHTGLVMAAYLEEPTLAYDADTYEPYQFLDGQTIFVHESQAITQLRHLGDPVVDDFIAEITDGLRQHPDIADGAETVYINDLFSRDSSFDDQCSEFTGGFETQVSLLHQCETGCKGDTLVTGYMIESTHPDYQVGADEGSIPKLQFENGDIFGLEGPIETWLDVDPFDGDPDRNRQESSAPPH